MCHVTLLCLNIPITCQRMVNVIIFEFDVFFWPFVGCCLSVVLLFVSLSSFFLIVLSSLVNMTTSC